MLIYRDRDYGEDMFMTEQMIHLPFLPALMSFSQLKSSC